MLNRRAIQRLPVFVEGFLGHLARCHKQLPAPFFLLALCLIATDESQLRERPAKDFLDALPVGGHHGLNIGS